MAVIEGIKQIDLTKVDVSAFKQQNTGCIVLTHDNRILLQYQPDNWRTFPGMVATFGGHIESTESPLNTIVRELNEELGATAKPDDFISLGVITEEITQHTELVHLYFWHDEQNTITGCYEGEAQYFNNVGYALAHPKLMEDVRWALLECQRRGLLG